MSKYDELKRLAEDMKGWPNKDAFESDDAWCVGSIDEDDNLWPVIEVQTERYDAFDASEPMATYYAAANPAAILELIAENERMREQCELNDMVHGTKGRERLAMLLKADADRASYWKQRAKSAEGHLYAGDMQQAARELHKRTSHSGTPWDELTVAQRAQIEGAVLAVVAAVNAKRDARQPVDCDMEASK